MEKGRAGIVRESSFGYQLGTRVVCTYAGKADGYRMYSDGIKMEIGDKGTITGAYGSTTQILLDNGIFVVRDETRKYDRFEPVKDEVNNNYETF